MSRPSRRPPSDPTLIVFANAIREVLRLGPLPGSTDTDRTTKERFAPAATYAWPSRRDLSTTFPGDPP